LFSGAPAWREWLAERHDRETEVLLGLHKKASGDGGMSWSEAVDEALFFGWIDGVRRRLRRASDGCRG